MDNIFFKNESIVSRRKIPKKDEQRDYADADWRTAHGFANGDLPQGWSVTNENDVRKDIKDADGRPFSFEREKADDQWQPWLDFRQNVVAIPQSATMSAKEFLQTTCWRPSDVPERGIDRIIGPFAAKGFVSVVAASGGTGKSSCMGTTAVGIAAGNEIVGWTVTRAARVFYMQAEDDTDMIRRALKGVAQKHHIEDHHIEDRLHIAGSNQLEKYFGKDLKALIEDEKGVSVNPQFRKKLTGLIVEGGFDVMVIDPLAVLYGGTQISNEAQNALIRAFVEIAQKTDVAIILVVHTRKLDQNKKAGVSDVKHGGELADAGRVVAVMNNLTKTEKEDWEGRSVHDPNKVVELTIGKSNIGPDGIRCFMEKTVELVKCQDGRTETVMVMTPALKPYGRKEQADEELWQKLKPILDTEFVSYRKADAAISLKEVIKQIDPDKEYHHGKVIKHLEAERWIVKEDHVNPKLGNDRKPRVRWVAAKA